MVRTGPVLTQKDLLYLVPRFSLKIPIQHKPNPGDPLEELRGLTFLNRIFWSCIII